MSIAKHFLKLYSTYYLSSGKRWKSFGAVLSKDKELDNNLDEKKNQRKRIAAIIAASLLSVGIIAFISVMIISLIMYRKYNKERNSSHNVESGHTPRIMLKKARKGPNNIRLTASR